jgi:NTE family protein
VIAVDLGSDIVGRSLRRPSEPPTETEAGWTQRVLARFGRAADSAAAETAAAPSMISVLFASINIMQVRIARSRLAGEPADVLIAPRLAQLGLMDYHRGAEAISEGRAVVLRHLPAIRYAIAAAS